MQLKTARPVARLRQGRTDWYRIVDKMDGPAEVYIYDEIGYWGVTAKDFVDELRQVNAASIDLHLNSPGGDVFDGIAIYQALVDHSASVRTIVDSLAASAASFIAQAGDPVIMTPAATMMIHDAFGIAVGNAADMRDLADRLDKVSDTIAGIYAERAGGTVTAWRDAMRAESWYDADEAVAAGLASEVRAGPGQRDATQDSWDLSIFSYAGRQLAPTPPMPATPAPAPPPAPESFVFDADIFRIGIKEGIRA